ncbi:plasmid mobilization relaxosome protein MobC [Hydrotalea sp. AMD]|uniref:plasmid mobilization protein n=1 Tax=Hydrotalea sp. AMD TaxID=2501297 RepID=UPI002580F79C|nr:plasmid mobilization relaxosome protein MobC [Hydrotalea sp. AMD]
MFTFRYAKHKISRAQRVTLWKPNRPRYAPNTPQEAEAMTEPEPPKRKKASLTKPVSFRLSETDHAAYMEKVELSGLKPSEFFRDCVLQNKTQVIAREKNSQERDRLIYLFNKASNNVNQLARRANTDYLAGKISENTYAGIRSELHELTHYLKAVIGNVD